MSFDEDSFFDGTNAPDQNFKNSVVSYPRNEQGFNQKYNDIELDQTVSIEI